MFADQLKALPLFFAPLRYPAIKNACVDPAVEYVDIHSAAVTGDLHLNALVDASAGRIFATRLQLGQNTKFLLFMPR